MIYDLRFTICASFALAASAWADESAWRVWLEPKFMHTPISAPITGAQKTEVVAGTLTDDGLVSFKKADFDALGSDWETFRTRAHLNAAADLGQLNYRFERNRRKIIAYAAVESDQPIVASTVLVPGFLDLWKETLGEKILIVVPNRFTAFLFPRLASDYLDYAPMIFRAYHETPYPVSVEVFEISADGWRCLGAYAEP
jgi:hypothetical protein